MANIKADEISKILREQIANYEQTVAVDEVGSIISVGDGIARIHGLDKVMAGEMLAFPHNIFGIALNLEEDEVGAVLLGETMELKEGDTVKRTNTIMSVPVGEALIGRVVSPLGEPLDGKGPIQAKQRNPLEKIAPGVLDRQPVRPHHGLVDGGVPVPVHEIRLAREHGDLLAELDVLEVHVVSHVVLLSPR